MSEPTIVIPYGDWLQEYREKEVSVSDDDEILDAVEQGLSAAQLARLVIVAREQGHAPDEIVPPNKLLLMAGGSKAIVNKITRRTYGRSGVSSRGCLCHSPMYTPSCFTRTLKVQG